jgi:hypothetical protein
MTLRAVLDDLIAAAVTVEAIDDGRLRLRAIFEDRPLTADTRQLAREHKPELLDYAWFAQEADALLLDSTRRLAAAWPYGYDLDTPEWNQHEQALHDAYWSVSLEQVKAALEARERYALAVFNAHRTEVRNA